MTIELILQILVFPALAMIYGRLDRLSERITRTEEQIKTLFRRGNYEPVAV